MTCSVCGAANPDAARFCNQCGGALGIPCRACRHVNPPDSRFCNACGEVLEEIGAAAKEPGSAPEAADALVAAAPAPAPAPEDVAPTRPGPRRPTLLPQVGAQVAADAEVRDGERKQVTVLFADVCGFTSMSEQLDPEDVHGIMNRCFEVLVKEVHRYEGTINQFTGDGIMALFGAPIARPDSPQRAVLAALSIQHALEDLSDAIQQERGIGFRIRIGINTGMAVVGAVGTDARADYTAVGDTTNLAARMEQMAEPGAILITEHTYRLVANAFACEPLGEQPIKGKTERVRIYRVLGLASGHSHGHDDLEGPATTFTGREEELRYLRKHVERGLAGAGRVIGVVGEAGIGKSRLVQELLQHIDRDRITVAEGHCLSYGTHVPYMPFIDLLQDLSSRGANGEHDGRGLHKLLVQGLEGGLEGLGEDITQVLVNGAGDGALPRRRDMAKRAVFDRILARLFDAATQGPMLLVLEDLQWVDPTSEELLGALIRGLAGKPVCLICTFAPGYRFPWADRSYYRHITLDALSPEAGTSVIRSLLGGGRVPPELLRLLHDEAEGNPLYIKACIQMLEEDGFLEHTSEGVRITKPLDQAHIPDSIQDIVMERIDRLAEPVKRTLQVAAVIGREFEAPLLTVVLAEEKVEPQLEALVAAELITHRAPDLYAFRQAVTSEVAYDSLLRGRRRDLHGRVAAAIERLYADELEGFYGRLGRHYAESEEPVKAIEYLVTSASVSERLGAVHEGAEQIEQALTILRSLAETPERMHQRVHLLERLTELRFLEGAVQQAAAAGTEALRLAEASDHTEKLGRLYVVLGGMGLFGEGSREEALARLRKGIQLCEAADDKEMVSQGYMHLGNALRQVGRWDEADACFRKMVDIASAARRGIQQVVGLNMLALTVMDRGNLAQALDYARRAVAEARESGNVWVVAFAEAFASDVYFEAGEWDDAETLATEALELADRLNVRFAQAYALATLGRIAAGQKDYRTAVKRYRRVLELSDRGPMGLTARIRLGEAHLRLKRIAQAHAYAQEAMHSRPVPKDLGRVERLRARLLAALTPVDLDAAQETIQSAVDRFTTLGMPLELGSSLVVQADLCMRAAQPARARTLLGKARELLEAAGAQARLAELNEVEARLQSASGAML